MAMHVNAWRHWLTLFGWLAIGCLGCEEQTNRGLAIRPVTLDEFAQGSATSTAPVPQTTPEAPAAALAQASAPAATPATTPAAVRPARALKAGDQLIIDSLIGQVSGRPIFADALLAPIADQLRRESEQSNPRDFVQRAKRIVDNRLREVVLNELFLAESESSLTQQQQQGLFAFLRNMRERTIAESLGSVSQREQELQQQQGLTLDQYMAARKDEVLIQNLLYQKVQPRVIVSWKDVQREYDRNQAKFNPPTAVTLRRIRLSNTGQKELVEQVTSRLENGESFDSVAASLDQASVRTLDPLPMKSGDVSDIEIIDDYKPYLKGLHEGQVTKPIVQKDRTTDDTVWLYVAKIDQPPHRTIYDVQRQLVAELERRRRDEQQQSYARSLFEKGIYDQLDEMSQRVLTVAVLRYGR